MVDCLPPFYVIYYVHCWICVVRTIPQEEVLHATVLSVCMDTCCSAYCGHPELPNNHQHLPWHDMVHRTCLHDCYQWCHGIYVWILLWQNPTDSTQPKEDLGRLHRGWHFYTYPWDAGKFLAVSFSSVIISLRSHLDTGFPYCSWGLCSLKTLWMTQH